MQRLKEQQIVNVQAYKHDGTLYRQWNGAKVLEVSPEYVVLFMYKAKVKESDGQRWVVREPMLWYMPKTEFYNTTGIIRNSGTYFYTNIASPPYFEDNTIKFIDYDLDIKAYPEQKTKVVDKGEFEFHKKKYNYSDELIEIIEKTVKKVLKLINFSDGCFDQSVIDSYVKELVANKELPKKMLKILL